MKQSSLQFKISQLRHENLAYTMDSIGVFLFSLFLSAFLPQILFRYLYANQQLLEQPKVLEYIPVAAFVIGVGFFIFAMVTNIMRKMKIMKLEKELAQLNEMGCDCGGMCDCGDHDHMSSGMADASWEDTSSKAASSSAALAQKMKSVNQKKKSKSRK
jgi:hypothetical protein